MTDELYDLMIAASPLTAMAFMVTKHDDPDARMVYQTNGFYPDMLDIITQLKKQYHIISICVYGPRKYITPFKQTLENRFENYDVKLIFAGEEN